MPVHEPIIVLCDRVKREAGTNKATLDGLFDKVGVVSFPAALNGTVYFRFLGATGSSGDLRLVLNRPNGLKEQLPAMKVNVAAGRVEGEIVIQGLPLLGKGKHVISLSWNNSPVASASFNVEQIQVVTNKVTHGPTEPAN